MAKQRYQPVDAALRLVDAVESMGWAGAVAGGSVAAASDILDAYERGIEAQPAPLPGADQNRGKAESRQGGNGAKGAGGGGGTPAEGTGRFAWAAYLVALCRAGLKPVSKVEPLQPDEVDSFVQEIGAPNPRTRILESASSGRVAHLFFGESPEKVDEAIAWTARGEDDPSDQVRDQAVCEAGKLLGYPSCCAEAFAFRETPRSRLSYVWMHMHRRMQCPEEVDALLNPWASALFESYVPCSLQCSATLELLRGAARVARRVRGDAEVDRMLESCARPWLVVLSGQGSALELIPEQEPGERFRYSAGSVVGQSAELVQAMRADELVIDHERLQLLHAGSLAADLSLRAFVWWHRRALQSELWTRVLALREYLGRDHHAGGRAALDVDGGLRLGPQMVALHKLLSVALADIGRGGRLQRIRVVRLRPVSAGMLSLELAAAGRTIELYVADARQTTQDAMRVGPFAFMRPEHQSLEAAVDKAVVQALSAQLSAWLVTRQRAVRQKGRGSS
jgi:hypothetical protein